MAVKRYVVTDPATESLLHELFSKISFGTNTANSKAGNMDGQIISVADSGVANSKLTLSHGLERVPVGFITTYIDSVGVVYDQGTAWTATTIYLSCSANNAAFSVFIW